MSVRVFAPAKINLTLEVGAPRADGYHPLQSVVAFAEEGDWIEATHADELTLTISGPFAAGLEAGETNLVIRAARLLDPERGAAIKLEKNLPIASGIGGGSSDAAAALLALNELWRLETPSDVLSAMAAKLGADVPVCLHKNSAWISGVGEEVAPMRVPPLHAVLVNPLKPLSTPSVYRRFDDMGLGAGFQTREAPHWADAEAAFRAAAVSGNNLEAPAISLMPELAPMLDALRSDNRAAYAALSGSGATSFALTRNAEDARAMAADLASAHPAWWIRATLLARA